MSKSHPNRVQYDLDYWIPLRMVTVLSYIYISYNFLCSDYIIYIHVHVNSKCLRIEVQIESKDVWLTPQADLCLKLPVELSDDYHLSTYHMSTYHMSKYYILV